MYPTWACQQVEGGLKSGVRCSRKKRHSDWLCEWAPGSEGRGEATDLKDGGPDPGGPGRAELRGRWGAWGGLWGISSEMSPRLSALWGCSSGEGLVLGVLNPCEWVPPLSEREEEQRCCEGPEEREALHSKVREAP